MLTFPAARQTDPVTHDQLAPSGLIGPPASGPCPMGEVFIEGAPAAHAQCNVECTGATSAGPAHPAKPPHPVGPPNPILTGSPTVFIHGQPAARWAPSGDITTCLSFLGPPPGVPRTVFIGNGIPTLPMRITIVKGTQFDSHEGRLKIAAMLAASQQILGIAIQVSEVSIIESTSRKTIYPDGNAISAMNDLGNKDQITTVFVDQIKDPAGYREIHGMTVSPKINSSSEHTGIIVGDAKNPITLVHELGHALSGKTDDEHSDDPANLMYRDARVSKDPATGELKMPEWTDPWKSMAEASSFLLKPPTVTCPMCGGSH